MLHILSLFVDIKHITGLAVATLKHLVALRQTTAKHCKLVPLASIRDRAGDNLHLPSYCRRISMLPQHLRKGKRKFHLNLEHIQTFVSLRWVSKTHYARSFPFLSGVTVVHDGNCHYTHTPTVRLNKTCGNILSDSAHKTRCDTKWSWDALKIKEHEGLLITNLLYTYFWVPNTLQGKLSLAGK